MSSATPLLSSATAQGASDAPSQSVVLPTLQQEVEQCVDAQLGLHEPTWGAFDDLLAKYNLRSKETGAAGNCQYCVVAHVLEQNGVSKPFATIRQEVATELTTHPERYVDFVSVEDGQDAQTEYSKLVERTKTEGEWGDHVTLQASCNAYGLSLLMFCSDGRTVDLQPTTTQTMHGNIAYLTGLHYRGTERLDAASAVIVPKDAVSLAAFLKVVLKDVGKRVLWEADEADYKLDEKSILMNLLKDVHNKLRTQSITGEDALHDLTHLLGGYLLSQEKPFRVRVNKLIEDKCKEQADKGKDITKYRANLQKLASYILDFNNFKNCDDVRGTWKSCVFKILHPLEKGIYREDDQLRCEDSQTVKDIIHGFCTTLNTDVFLCNVGEQLGVLYEHFKNDYLKEGKKDGQYFTPERLVRAILALLPKDLNLPADATVYDPSMGTACFLTSFAQHCSKNYPKTKLTVCGQELRKQTYSLAKVATTLVQNLAESQTDCANTLVLRDTTKHDIVLANPPFLRNGSSVYEGKTTKHGIVDLEDKASRLLDYCVHYDKAVPLSTFQDPNNEDENSGNKPKIRLLKAAEKEFRERYPFNCSRDPTLGMFVTHCFNKTKQGGHGAIVVPVGPRLCSGNQAGALALREWMVNNFNIYQILDVPKGVFQHAGVSTVVIFYKHEGVTDSIRFASIDVGCTRVEEEFTVSREELDKHEWQFESNVYRKEEDDSFTATMVELGALFTFEKGSLQSSKAVEGKYSFITASDEDKTHHSFDQEDECLLFVNGSDGSLAKTKHWKGGKFTASSLLLVLKKKTNNVNYGYVARILKEKRPEIRQTISNGCAKRTISKNDLAKYKIPLPPLHIQRQIVDDITPLDTLRTHLQTVIDTHKHRQKMYLRSMLRLHGGSCGKVALGEICTFKSGNFNANASKKQGKYPFYKGRSQNPCGFSDEFTFDLPKYILFVKGGGSGPGKYGDHIALGKTYSVEGKSAVTSHLLCLTLNNPDLHNFVALYLQLHKNDLMDLARYTTGLGSISQQNLTKFQIPLPPLDLQTQWAAYLQTIQTSIDDCTHALANLEQERNDILQSYLTAPPAPSTVPQCDAAPNTTDGAAPPTHPNTATGEGGTPEHASFTPTTPTEKKALAYLTKHNLAHIVDWQARTIQGVPFSTLHTLTDFRKGDGRAFRQKLKEVDTKKLKKVVELLGKCV